MTLSSKGATYERREAVWAKGKLALRFIGPFPIVESVGRVAYRQEQLEKLSAIQGIDNIDDWSTQKGTR